MSNMAIQSVLQSVADSLQTKKSKSGASVFDQIIAAMLAGISPAGASNDLSTVNQVNTPGFTIEETSSSPEVTNILQAPAQQGINLALLQNSYQGISDEVETGISQLVNHMYSLGMQDKLGIQTGIEQGENGQGVTSNTDLLALMQQLAGGNSPVLDQLMGNFLNSSFAGEASATNANQIFGVGQAPGNGPALAADFAAQSQFALGQTLGANQLAGIQTTVDQGRATEVSSSQVGTNLESTNPASSTQVGTNQVGTSQAITNQAIINHANAIQATANELITDQARAGGASSSQSATTQTQGNFNSLSTILVQEASELPIVGQVADRNVGNQVSGTQVAVKQTANVADVANSPGLLNINLNNPVLKPYAGRLQAVAKDIAAASQATGVDPKLLAAFMIQESGVEQFSNGRVKREAYGGIGIMQIAQANSGGYDLTDQAQNILRGAQILKGYLDKYGGNPGLAAYAYNSGPGALASAFKLATGRNINSLSPAELRKFDPKNLQQAIYQDALNRGYSTNVAVVKRDYALKLVDKLQGLSGSTDFSGLGTFAATNVGQGVSASTSRKIGSEDSSVMLPVLNLPIIGSGTELNFSQVDLKQEFAPLMEQAFKEMGYVHQDSAKSFEVKLQPDQLGSLVVKVSLDNGQLNTHIVVSSSHVATLFNNQLGDLRHVLSQQGFVLGQLDVGLQQNSQQGSQERWGGGTSGSYQGSHEEDTQTASYVYQKDSGQALDILA